MFLCEVTITFLCYHEEPSEIVPRNVTSEPQKPAEPTQAKTKSEPESLQVEPVRKKPEALKARGKAFTAVHHSLLLFLLLVYVYMSFSKD